MVMASGGFEAKYSVFITKSKALPFCPRISGVAWERSSICTSLARTRMCTASGRKVIRVSAAMSTAALTLWNRRYCHATYRLCMIMLAAGVQTLESRQPGRSR